MMVLSIDEAIMSDDALARIEDKVDCIYEMIVKFLDAIAEAHAGLDSHSSQHVLSHSQAHAAD